MRVERTDHHSQYTEIHTALQVLSSNRHGIAETADYIGLLGSDCHILMVYIIPTWLSLKIYFYTDFLLVSDRMYHVGISLLL